MKCRDCHWYMEVYGPVWDIVTNALPIVVSFICSYPDNVTIDYIYASKVKRMCEDLNSDGQCGWFKKLT